MTPQASPSSTFFLLNCLHTIRQAHPGNLTSHISLFPFHFIFFPSYTLGFLSHLHFQHQHLRFFTISAFLLNFIIITLYMITPSRYALSNPSFRHFLLSTTLNIHRPKLALLSPRLHSYQHSFSYSTTTRHPQDTRG